MPPSDDLHLMYPTAEEYHADPEGATQKWLGPKVDQKRRSSGPRTVLAFGGRSIAGTTPSRFRASGALNRLCVHPSVVDFAERALGTPDIRQYQTHSTAKYSGLTNYEQPMHIDRNHSVAPRRERGTLVEPRRIPLPL